MNDLLEALLNHYNKKRFYFFIDPNATDARAVDYTLRKKAHTVVWREAVEDVGKVAAQLELLSRHAPYDVLVCATWKNGITKGDREALEAAGITVLALEREAEHADRY